MIEDGTDRCVTNRALELDTSLLFERLHSFISCTVNTPYVTDSVTVVLIWCLEQVLPYSCVFAVEPA